MASRGCLFALGIFAIAFFLLGVFLLIPFPIAVFPSIVKSQLHLSENADGSYPTLTHYWAKFPVNSYYDYYLFNVSNFDEVMYEGALPSFYEVGPYSYKESEFKEDVNFFEDGNKVSFRNNKTFIFTPSKSCEACTADSVITLPNAAYMSVANMIVLYRDLPNIKTNAFLLDLLTILLGETPFRTVPATGVLFDGYDDPFIDLLNSNLTKTLVSIMGGTLLGMQVPPIHTMGYFPKYNHTSDENYVAYTGKNDVDKTAQIIKWAGNKSLDWWGDEYSRNLLGAGDGSFQKPQLSKKDTVKMFQSYACRNYHLVYDSSETYKSIDTYVFKMESDDYDSTSEKNKGYRYENHEKVDYFPTWPDCNANKTYNPNQKRCNIIDCSMSQNWCDDCCDGTHTKNTVYLPPGLVPMRCLPGQNIRLPFAGFLSPPHFLGSPEQVVKRYRGIQPNPDLHEPARFNIQPLTGSTVNARFRMQFHVPYYTTKAFTMLHNVAAAMAPTFWVNIQIEMKNYAHDYIQFSTSTIPKIALGVGVGLVCIPVLGALVALLFKLRRRKHSSTKISLEDFVKETRDSNPWN